MAGSNYTLASNTWWTTGSSAGAGDGTSFANRKTIPTDILSITLNADATYTQVHETASGAMVLGNNTVAACTLTFYGTFLVVGQNNLFTDVLAGGVNAAIRCAIGGTTGFKEGQHSYLGVLRVANLDIGQQSDGTATCAGGVTVFKGDIYVYNSTTKMTTASTASAGSTGGYLYFESCNFNGGASGSSYAFRGYNGVVNFISCTQTTTGGNWLYSFSGSAGQQIMNIIGGITKGGSGGASIYFGANSALRVNYFRRAYLKTVDASAVALSGAAFGAYEATGGVEQPLTSGVTGASGLAKPQSPTIYNDSLWCLQKVETYVRVTDGTMEWGSPTSTDTYGNYTHTFSKTGYNTQTQTHDFTDGNDWGTSASPIAITMTAATPKVTAAELRVYEVI